MNGMRAKCFSNALVAGICVFLASGSAYSENRVSFDRDVLPVLAEHCFACHGPDANQRKAELRLDLEEGAKASVLVPGDADASELIRRITSTDPEVHMPPPDSNIERLSADEIAAIRTWIDDGAEWAQHWSYVAPKHPETPPIANADWARNEIDHFIAARLQDAGLEPSPEASRETLARRLAFDLTGLPPTLDMIDAFVANTSADAYEKLVDRLLASPDFGEHMARDWLDGARYADTNGYQNDFQRNMWPWRDWVINAFNANMPFDQFTVEQLAGDLLPNATDAQIIATGFNRNNRANTEGGSIEEEWRIENIVDRVETTGTMFLGLSIGCARCHDHKYDPITQEDFYEFFAFFNSTADRGFYQEMRGNAGPTVSLPSFENQVRLTEYNHSIDQAESALDKLNAARPFEYLAWHARLKTMTNADAAPDAVFAASLDDATAVNEGLSLVDGLDGSAIQFAGTPASLVDLSTPVTFDREQPFTVSVWVRPDSTGAVFSKMDDAAANRGVDLLVSEDKKISVHLVSAWPDNAIKVVSGERLRMGTWAHVSVSYDGTSKAEGLRVYVDGVPAPLTIEKDALSDSIATDAPLRIGSRSSGEHFTGAITDFRIFDVALDSDALRPIIEKRLASAVQSAKTAEAKKRIEDFFDLQYWFQVKDDGDRLSAIRKEKADYFRESVPTVMVMKELSTPRETYRLKRGAYDAPDTTKSLYPDVPGFLPPLPNDAPQDRLGLARWLVSPENPLTARVTVNRYWQMIFGRGLVKTAEDFGLQGAPPTHPELLDWLATEFVASGWDVKGLLKRIAMSATYRQSSNRNEHLLNVDPAGILMASAPRYRLTAEALRDNALAVSGLLTREIGGPSVKPYQPAGLWEELAGGAGEGPYVIAEGDDLYRRSLYTYRKRTVPPPSLTTFDSPGWDLCRVRRGLTNTPLQALALLNDVTYAEAARNLGQRMIAEGGSEAKAQIIHGFRLVTGRRPTDNELKVLQNGLDGYLNTFSSKPDDAAALIAVGQSAPPENADATQLAAFTSLASVILNLDEAITRE